MNYEISAGTARILNQSRKVASEYGLRQANALCLLLSLLAETVVTTVLRRNGIDVDSLILETKGLLASMAGGEPQPAMGEEADLPALDADSMRVAKLSVLEARLAGGRLADEVLLLLGLLHDRQNPAKDVAARYGVEYDKIAQSLRQKRASFDFAEEDPTPYPGDGAGGGDSQGQNAMRQKQPPRQAGSETPITDNFGTDLTAIAAKGGLDPVVGREREIERMVQILCRRKKNNPVLIGEPGVGKSAIVEGLADRMAKRKVPRLLGNKRIVALDMASVVAGTQYRGQFEERLRRLIQELKANPDIILFIDEIHTIIGAGSAPGSLDAANILKPALARGEIQCIGATTTGEFRKSIEKDGALERRFQKIQLEPTTEAETLAILRNIKPRYEEHHNVTYTDEALRACVELTGRYVSDRALPDKAIDALDEAGSRMHLLGTGTPKEIEEKEKEIEEVRERKFAAAQEQNYELAANLRDQLQQLQGELDRLTTAWQEEQKNHPSIVDEPDVAEVVSMMSGVPATRIAAKESERLKGMKQALQKRVIHQDTAVDRLCRAILRSRIGLKGTERPIGTFMFVGPTGVGKTHLVKCLSEWMFGTKDSLIRIDMSEYGEKYSVSRLLGAPPGYVGYEEGGQLTERVRRHPYSVVLLDEIEKAHPDVFNTLLQVMDEGRLTDGNGVTVDFRNTIIILTSNSGTRQLREFGNGIGFGRTEREVSSDMAEGIVMKVLRRQFAPEFLNRLDDIIMFSPLDKESAAQIAQLEIGELQKRMQQTGYSLEVADEALALVVSKGFDAQYGARSLKRAIQHYIEDALCDAIMENAEAKSFRAVLKNGKIELEQIANA